MSRTSATTSKKTAISSASDPGYARLHISPLDADLLSVIVPTAVRPDVRNVSYHGLQTFPEKRFGFVDLPSAAADKLRNKLNGAVLKGVKLRIQPARERKREQEGWAGRKPGEDDEDDEAMSGRNAGKERPKRGARGKKADNDFMQSATFGLTTWRRLGGAASEEIPGIQLEAGRQVKRGWTEGEDEKIARKKAKKEERSSSSSSSSNSRGGRQEPRTEQKMRQKAAKYTDKKECLMKTILPPKAMAAEKAAAAAAAAAAAPTTATAAVAAGDEDEETRARRRKRDQRARHVVVHEFAHSTKFPTFLRSAGDGGVASRANLEYVDGKGWVDGQGAVVEAMLSTRPAVVAARIDSGAMRAKIEKVRQASKDGEAGGETGDSETSDSGDSSSEDGDTTSSSGDSDDDDDDESTEAQPKAGKTQPSTAVDRPKSSGSAKGLTIKIPPAVEVHPLEALYKKPKAAGGSGSGSGQVEDGGDDGQAAAEPFSFFGASADGGDDDDDADDGQRQSPQQPPMTPYTQKELEWRNVRSAAPTPDTAHPSRMGSVRWPLGGGTEEEDEEEGDEDDEDDNDGGDAGQPKHGREAAAPDEATGSFESWFWDNRGDLNRSWKRRRKTAAKDKRYRDNRARAGRAI